MATKVTKAWARHQITKKEKMIKDHDHLRDVVGSLMIAQFKGENKQDQYRAVINAIFAEVSQDGGQK